MPTNQGEPRIVGYAQQRDFTCGAACLMVALHELGRGELSEQRELDIWRAAHPPFYTGCLPAALARRARHEGCDATLLVEPTAFRSQLQRCPPGLRLFYRYLLAVERLLERGLTVERIREPAEPLRRLIGRPGARMLLLVEVEDHDLHYLLVRRNDNDLVVLDPADGRNTRRPLQSELLPDNATGYYLFIEPGPSGRARASGGL
ncbi:MAG: peptidase C39 family protein [Kiritimatiellae bacterium]|nr:peptidase C39 family protein [Kiritimatiellia bacterium]